VTKARTDGGKGRKEILRNR